MRPERHSEALLDGLLARLGVQPRPYRAMVGAFLLCDLRSQHFARATGARTGERLTPLFWVVAQYLAASALLTACLYARVDLFFFAFAGLAASMTLLGVALVVEIHEVVLRPEDLWVIGPRPVGRRTHAAARLTNLLAYVLLLTAALNVFPALVGLGLREATWAYLPSYLVASLVGSAGVTLLVLALQGLAHRLEARAREALAWTQIVVILVLFYGGQLMLKDSGYSVSWLAYRPPAWLELLPPAWLARAVAAAEPSWSAAFLWCAGLAAVAAMVAASAALLARGLARGPAPAAPGHRPRAALAEPGRQEAAALHLAELMVRRDPDYLGRVLPYLGMAVGGGLLGAATGQMGDPFAAPLEECRLSLVAPLLLVLAAPVAVQALAFSRDPEAAWILRTAPIRDAHRFRLAMARFLERILFAPAFLALFAALAWLWKEPLHAAVHCLLGWLCLLGAVRASLGLLPEEGPFSRRPAAGETFGPVVLFQGALMGVLALLATAQVAAYSDPRWTGLYAALLAAAVVAYRTPLGRWSRGAS